MWKLCSCMLHISKRIRFACWQTWTVPGVVATVDEGVRLWCWTGLRLLDLVLLPDVDRSLSLHSFPGDVAFFSLHLFNSSLLGRSLFPDDSLLHVSTSLCFPAVQNNVTFTTISWTQSVHTQFIKSHRLQKVPLIMLIILKFRGDSVVIWTLFSVEESWIEFLVGVEIFILFTVSKPSLPSSG